MTSSSLGFRPGTVLATRFTGTLTERRGDPVERLTTPRRLLDWLELNDLAVDGCTDDELDLAVELREAIHDAASATAVGEPLLERAVGVLNERSSGGHATARLTSEGRREWWLGPAPVVADALAVIAADAITVVSGEREGRLALCDSPTCRAAFLDVSRGRTRRWCDMNTCGNKEKKARFRAGRGPTSDAAPASGR